MLTSAIFSTFFAIFRPLIHNKTSPNYFLLVEEVLSFSLVGHMWKSIKNWLQEWVFNIYKWKWGRSRWIAYFENYLQKWFGENLAGKSCGTRRGKSQFKKDSDWWKFSIWNRVMGSQPIRIQLGKILQENFAGKSCGKFLQENLAGNSCRKFLWKILVRNCSGKSCGKILEENLVGNRAGNSCGKFLRENLVGNSSRSTSFSLVNVKNSFLKPILDGFLHMTHKNQSLEPPLQEKIVWWCFIVCKGPKNGKKCAENCQCQHCLLLLGPLQAIKHHQTIFYL